MSFYIVTVLMVMSLLLSGSLLAGEVITVDLASDLGPVTYRASGFLHAMSIFEPKPEMVDPLKPKLFRMRAEDWHSEGKGAWANYGRVKKLGARMQVVISDSHGYKYAWWWPGDNNDWKAWDDLIEKLVKRAQAGKRKVEWDIWNEPNHGYFWDRDRDRFFETWRRGFLKIRELDPEAVIMGPSISYFDKAYLQDFLLYCKANNVVPDILVWHEFGAPGQIQPHVEHMRKFMKDNGISERPICLNEIINGEQSTKPGVTAQYFAAIERARVDGACHACWNDRDNGVSACENNSLDGILTHPDKKPRSTWWVYKAYADITGRLIEVRPDKSVDGVAGFDAGSKMVRAVIGRDAKEPGDVEVVFANMSAAPYLSKKVRVVVEKIPHSGWEELPAPVKVMDEVRQVQGNTLKITLPAFGPSDAYSVALGAPENS